VERWWDNGEPGLSDNGVGIVGWARWDVTLRRRDRASAAAEDGEDGGGIGEGEMPGAQLRVWRALVKVSSRPSRLWASKMPRVGAPGMMISEYSVQSQRLTHGVWR
jgi:hypothetical protein